MATEYPEGLDNFTNPAQGQSRSTTGVEEWLLISNLNDAVEAIEAALGATPYGPYANVGNYLSALRSAPFVLTMDETLDTPQFTLEDSTHASVVEVGAFDDDGNWHLRVGGQQAVGNANCDIYREKNDGFGQGISLVGTNLAATTSAAAHFGIGSDIYDDHSTISAGMHVYSVTEGGDLGSVFTYASATELKAQIAVNEFTGQTAPYLTMGPADPTYSFSPGGLCKMGRVEVVDYWDDGSRYLIMGGTPVGDPGTAVLNLFWAGGTDYGGGYYADVNGTAVHDDNVARASFAIGADMNPDGTYVNATFSVNARNLADKWAQVGMLTQGENLTAQVYVIGYEGQTAPLLRLMDGPSTDVFTVTTTGIGFFNGAAVAKPTGVGVDAASIHAALVTLNLIAA